MQITQAFRPANLALRVRDYWFRYFTVPKYLKKIGPGDVVIDCGANVGTFTGLFAQRGAQVYAFEPHPIAFAALEKRFRGMELVQCLNQAVSSKAGRMKLFLRPDDDSLAATQSASLMDQKENISTSHFVEVEVIRLVDFIAQVAPVRFIKMDIEGAEYHVLPDLLDAGMLKNIGQIVVETHERSPGLYNLHSALLKKIEREEIENIDLAWH